VAKKLTEILENFTNDLRVDLDELNQKIAHNGREVDSYFEKISNYVEDWTSKVQSSFESISVNVEVRSILLKEE
jgi:deoxyadenosine/deoxycytidine kinase